MKHIKKFNEGDGSNGPYKGPRSLRGGHGDGSNDPNSKGPRIIGHGDGSNDPNSKGPKMKGRGDGSNQPISHFELDSDEPEDMELMDIAEEVGSNPELKKNWTKNLGVPVTTQDSENISLDVICELIKLGYKIVKE